MNIYSDDKLSYKIVMELDCCSESTAVRRIRELKEVIGVKHVHQLYVSDYVEVFRVPRHRVIWRDVKID